MGATTSAQDTKGGKPPGNGVLSETLPKDCLWFLLNSTKIIASGAGAASAYARSASSDATPTGLWMSCTGLWPAASGAATASPSVPKAALTLEYIAPSSLPLVEDAPLSDLQRDMLFKTRRSTRAYKDEPVDRNVLLKALEEARYAPTASNCEEVAWLLVEGRDRLHDLASRVADWMLERLPENTAMWHRLSAPGRIRSCGGPPPSSSRTATPTCRGTLSTVPPPSAIWSSPCTATASGLAGAVSSSPQPATV